MAHCQFEYGSSGFLVPFIRPFQGLSLRYQLPMHLARSEAGLLRLSICYLDEPTRREAVRVLFGSYVEERNHGNPNDQRREQNLAISLFSCGDCFLEFLVGALTNAQPRIREQAASLVGFQKTPTNFIGALTGRLSDSTPGVRWQAVVSLARFRKDGPTVVPIIMRGLGDSEASVRRASIQSLQRFGPQAQPALPDLRALAERDEQNREIAIECIRGLDGAEADRLAAKLRAK